jgi:hypothetical protein
MSFNFFLVIWAFFLKFKTPYLYAVDGQLQVPCELLFVMASGELSAPMPCNRDLLDVLTNLWYFPFTRC